MPSNYSPANAPSSSAPVASAVGGGYITASGAIVSGQASYGQPSSASSSMPPVIQQGLTGFQPQAQSFVKAPEPSYAPSPIAQASYLATQPAQSRELNSFEQKGQVTLRNLMSGYENKVIASKVTPEGGYSYTTQLTQKETPSPFGLIQSSFKGVTDTNADKPVIGSPTKEVVSNFQVTPKRQDVLNTQNLVTPFPSVISGRTPSESERAYVESGGKPQAFTPTSALPGQILQAARASQYPATRAASEATGLNVLPLALAAGGLTAGLGIVSLAKLTASNPVEGAKSAVQGLIDFPQYAVTKVSTGGVAGATSLLGELAVYKAIPTVGKGAGRIASILDERYDITGGKFGGYGELPSRSSLYKVQPTSGISALREIKPSEFNAPRPGISNLIGAEPLTEVKLGVTRVSFEPTVKADVLREVTPGVSEALGKTQRGISGSLSQVGTSDLMSRRGPTDLGKVFGALEKSLPEAKPTEPVLIGAPSSITNLGSILQQGKTLAPTENILARNPTVAVAAGASIAATIGTLLLPSVGLTTGASLLGLTGASMVTREVTRERALPEAVSPTRYNLEELTRPIESIDTKRMKGYIKEIKGRGMSLPGELPLVLKVNTKSATLIGEPKVTTKSGTRGLSSTTSKSMAGTITGFLSGIKSETLLDTGTKTGEKTLTDTNNYVGFPPSTKTREPTIPVIDTPVSPKPIPSITPIGGFNLPLLSGDTRSPPGGQGGDRASTSGSKGKGRKLALFYTPTFPFPDILAFKGLGFGKALPQKQAAKYFKAAPFPELIPSKEFVDVMPTPTAQRGKIETFKKSNLGQLSRLVFGKKARKK
jgi:hypothetical protein